MHTRTHALRVLLAVAAVASLPGPALAASLDGMVATTEGKPVAGAMVTLWNEARNRKETVYTDAGGAWRLDTGFAGKLVLRARAPMHRDFNLDIELAADAIQSHNLALEPLTDAQEISDSLTASAHAAALPFPDAKTKGTFIAQCSYCHQQGNSMTRIPRAREMWSDSVWRMEGYGAYITYGEHRRIVELLFKGFDGKPLNVVQTHTYSPDLARARVEEWQDRKSVV